MTETRTEKELQAARSLLPIEHRRRPECRVYFDGDCDCGADDRLDALETATRADERAKLAAYHEEHAVPLPHEPDGTVSATTLWQAVSNLRATIAAMKEELTQSWEHGVAQTRALERERDDHRLTIGERDAAAWGVEAARKLLAIRDAAPHYLGEFNAWAKKDEAAKEALRLALRAIDDQKGGTDG